MVAGDDRHLSLGGPEAQDGPETGPEQAQSGPEWPSWAQDGSSQHLLQGRWGDEQRYWGLAVPKL